MSYNMYLFTKGDGPLKTTHDLFTQAEFFAEQANKMYKTVREFAYEVSNFNAKIQSVIQMIHSRCCGYTREVDVINFFVDMNLQFSVFGREYNLKIDTFR